jgi:hypothetical protein
VVVGGDGGGDDGRVRRKDRKDGGSSEKEEPGIIMYRPCPLLLGLVVSWSSACLRDAGLWADLSGVGSK